MPDEVTLHLSLAVAGLGSALLLSVAAAALVRRRTLPYLLITTAIAALATRSVLGAVSIRGHLSMHSHHVAEHVLDALIIGLLIAAMYGARRARPEYPPADSQLGNPR